MTALVPFVFEDHLFRALDREGEPWFVAGDVAKILGYGEAKDMTRTLDDDEKGRHTVPTPGGVQGVSVISEPGLYRVIAQRRASSKIGPEIRAFIARFQRWLFHDVLPTLRRAGAYVMPGAQPPTDREQNQDTEYRRRLDTVSEARRLYGSARAQLLYEKLGLPEVPELPDPPPAEIPAALAGDPLVTAIITLLEASPSGVWRGTPTAFLKALSAPGIAPEHARASPHWPAFPKTLSVAIKRIAPALNALGVEIVRRHSQVTTWTLRLLREPATNTATGSAPEGKAFH